MGRAARPPDLSHYVTYPAAGLVSLLRSVKQFRPVGPPVRTLVVEALPSHFPGGVFRKHGGYPHARADRHPQGAAALNLTKPVCDDARIPDSGYLNRDYTAINSRLALL